MSILVRNISIFFSFICYIPKYSCLPFNFNDIFSIFMFLFSDLVSFSILKLVFFYLSFSFEIV